MTEHTPGPWLAEKGGVVGHGAPVIRRDHDGPITHVAYLTRGLPGDGWPDARLIARAPDLLAENTRLLTLLKDITQGDVIIGGSSRDASLLAENARLREVNAGLVGAVQCWRAALKTGRLEALQIAFEATDAALRAAEEGA